MQNAIVINGRLIGPQSVELDEPVSDLSGEVEVTLRPRLGDVRGKDSETISEFLRRLKSGTRTKEEIDRQIRGERDAWGDSR